MKDALNKIASGKNLTREEAAGVMRAIMEGSVSEAQIGAFLLGMKIKGEVAEELSGFVDVMRDKSEKIIPADNDAIDMCGTGGDNAGTFNVSTVASFVVAGAGVTVAKHGNRSVSSSCGSADVLRELGVTLDISAGKVAECVDSVGIGFLFAPLFHPSMRHAAKARAELGMKTCFNMLGPLTNPAGVRRQLVGTFDAASSGLMAGVFATLRPKKIFLVTSEDGMDEVSLGATTLVIELAEGALQKKYEVPSTAFGLAHVRRDAIRGGTPAHNAAIALEILRGGHGPFRDTVIANSAFGLMAAGKASTIYEGVAMATESIDSGKALGKLDRLREATKK